MTNYILTLKVVFIQTLMFFQCFGQLTKTEKEKIIYSLKEELNDSITIMTRTEGEIYSMINLMEKNLVIDSLFPYQVSDSVVYSVYENYIGVEPVNWKKRKIIKTKTIENEKTIKFLELLNNPLNFQMGECGTPIIESKLEFWKNGVVFATVDFACSYGQIFCEPKNEMIRWGVLNDKGNEILDKIGLWR